MAHLLESQYNHQEEIREMRENIQALSEKIDQTTENVNALVRV